MSLGSWNPADGSQTLAYRPDTALLKHCATFASSDNWGGLASWIQENLPPDAGQMMKLDAHSWQQPLHDLDNNTLLQLVRFFTVAEQMLPHWHGGDQSPVIWISRTLKKRGTPLPRDLVLWIKANSDNRFLPNGPIL
ncbi:MAG TPA: hypothetical protein PLF22_01535 [Pseudomonadales bacterium]|nr:hypothetical protein [Pseudomonadales bacterium]